MNSKICRACFKPNNHSIHDCIRKKQEEQKKKEDREYERNHFISKYELNRSAKTKRSNNQEIERFVAKYCRHFPSYPLIQPIGDHPSEKKPRRLNKDVKLEEFLAKYCKPFRSYPLIQPIGELPSKEKTATTSPFKTPTIPKQRNKKLRIAPINPENWYGYTFNTTSKNQHKNR